ncbi:MAG: NAD(P)/FAD-dependent oxidoreductase [Trebonia sp.]
MEQGADAVIIGAGVVGAACAYFLSAAGASVTVVDRGWVAGGTSGAGEGNILVSDKELGPELELALLSNRLWRELGDTLGEAIELELKGGLIVAGSDQASGVMAALAERQREHGVEAVPVPAEGLADLEPNISRELRGGVSYPQDMQVQPMLAAAHLLAAARQMGARLCLGQEVTSVLRGRDGAVQGVTTSKGSLSARVVVNAAGTWSGEIARLAGVELPIHPRRGFILVTEPLPLAIRRKVYTAEYVANVASGAESLQTSTVVEGTRSGTVLIGATRERAAFDRTISWEAIARLAAGAVEVFPFLAEVRALRTYFGFRPYCPDHLPVIGADPRVPGLIHACGHEGAGVGLAPATGWLVARVARGSATEIPLDPFAPNRFDEMLADVR